MSLLLDTQIVVWWLSGEKHKLSGPQFEAIRAAIRDETPLRLAAITLWEIAMLGARGRLIGAEQCVRTIEEESRAIDVLPITATIALEAATFGKMLPGDPGDRLIVATARVFRHTLVTADDRIRRSDLVQVI